jgi:rod shape-determining protein MreC
MKVLTSNFSLKFPAGIPIGTIKTVKKKATSSFYDIQLQLATNFNNLDYVYVVRDNFRPQLDSLEIKEEVQDVP